MSYTQSDVTTACRVMLFGPDHVQPSVPADELWSWLHEHARSALTFEHTLRESRRTLNVAIWAREDGRIEWQIFAHDYFMGDADATLRELIRRYQSNPPTQGDLARRIYEELAVRSEPRIKVDDEYWSIVRFSPKGQLLTRTREIPL